jgi:Zn-dependent protease with chaperone function
MYGSVLTFLIAIAIQALAPRAEGAAWSLAEVAHQVVYPIAVWAALRIRFRRLMARALHEESEARALRAGFSSMIQAYQGVMLIPFALLLFLTQYPSLVIAPLAPRSLVLEGLLGILPFVGLLLLLWWESYPLHGVLYGRVETRREFTYAHARMELPVILPWLLLLALLDLLRFSWPGAFAAVESNELLELLFVVPFLALLWIFFPVIIRRLWGCQPLPPGPLRERFDALCSRLRIRVAEYLVWPLLGGRVMNAAILGPVARFRYLLVTPALLETLSTEELDGVVAHEAGHVRHHHLLILMLLFTGYIFLITIFLRLAYAGIRWWDIIDPEVIYNPRRSAYVAIGVILGVVAILALYVRGLFGALSRAFERQADAFALTALGRPGPLVSAFERISFFSGDIRDLPSWHHGSIAQRVDFLETAAAQPAVLHAQARRVRRFTVLFALGVVAAAALAVALHAGPLSVALDRFVTERGLLHRVAKNPQDAASWFVLGSLYQELERSSDAEKAYEEAIRLDPRNPQALNNLAWLYATSKDPKLDKPERALALAEMAVRLAPTPHILDTLAEARWRAHDTAGALQAIDAALAQKPANRDYYLGQREKFLATREGR